MVARGFLIGSLIGPCLALAQSPPTKGWTKNANMGVNLSYSSSEGVVGQTDGTSQTYGVNLKGGLNRMSESDEWRNNFSLLENTTKTPALPRFAKSGDELKIDTAYLYSWPGHKDIGPYVRGEVSAPIFKGEDLRSEPTTYLIKSKAVPAGQTVVASSVPLTQAFRPLNTSESIGMFLKAVNQDNLKLEARVGIGALQVRADGQYAVKGDNGAGAVEIDELSDVDQIGLEAALSVKGKVDEKSTYEAGVETLTPFITNKPATDDRSALGLTDVTGFAKFNTNLSSWAALSYDYKLKIQPQLIDRAQQIHMVVLNISYNIF